MCGIVGFVSNTEQTAEVLLEGLKALEYRGYDSCGIALMQAGEMHLIKAKGKIANLEEKCPPDLKGNCGIGHTRWATHGEPSEINAHPHRMDQVTLVHNGIIENSDLLREEYEKLGVHFSSQTDTETACAVIDDCLRKTNSKYAALKMARQILKGSYALAILFQDEPDRIYALKKDSPLILGVGEDSVYLASDVCAFLKWTNRIIELDESEIAVLSGEGITFLGEYGSSYQKEPQVSEVDLQEIQKEGYDTFLLKEIHEEPRVIKRTVRHYMGNTLEDLMETMPDLSKYHRFVFVGCGSAMHAGMVAKQLMERKARVLSSMEIASEFRYANPILTKDTCAVFISQSGETADTLAALRMCKEMGIDTIAVVNVLGSSIAKEADVFLPTLAGKEISVATTKAYCAQVAVLSLLCLKKAMQERLLDGEEQKEIEQEIHTLPKLLKNYLDNTQVECFAGRMRDSAHAFFIGRGLDYALSLEGSLKLKEISYMHSEAYAAGELKHGTISLIEEGTPVVACISDARLVEKTLSNMKEVKARGAEVLLMIREDLAETYRPEADIIIRLPKVHSTMQAIVSILPYQLLAYYIAKARGCDIDQPRNLAKSVTVE